MKKMIIIACLLLTACGGQVDVTTTAIKRAPLNLTIQNPLNLKPVQLKVKVENQVPNYCMSGQNFANMANNMEKIQNHLDIQKQQLEAQKHYYDNLN